MTKRRMASILVTGGKVAFRGGNLPIVVAPSGTGTATRGGVFTLICTAAPTTPQMISTGSIYLTLSAGTNIGTLVGTGLTVGTA